VAYAYDISQVFYNRMAIDMALESDATVSYANRSGAIATSEDERNIDSPYNTYINTGLPPGAISGPGRVALDAAVHPHPNGYYYFVAVNPFTGETKFGATLAEHEANAAEFEQWCYENQEACFGE
jgi:UPF0755 protein